ncbi:MAG: ABC transporter ATP-binding protein [Faecalibacterium sp.]|jgi:ABC-2 type transport system ATP-binding protein|nr:ABC transporter ATP-binding protein [Faecalibacterium sp.]
MSEIKQNAQLCAKNVSKRYGTQKVLDNLNLTIEPGCIYGLIGRNGAGKTTLLGILTGQNTKDGGEVTYGGSPVWENRAALDCICFSRELSGASPVRGQNSLKVKNYLEAAKVFYPAWDAAYAARLIEKFGMKDMQKKAIFKLSKGQMSMVTIVIALASCAPITILDEPVAGLDVVAREQFYRLLLDDYARTNRTFVLSTHIIEEAAKVFERVIVLDEGHIIADRPTEELVDEFRYVSGPDDALDEAIRAAGGEALETQMLGRHKMVAVRGSADTFAALAADATLSVEPMNLQNVFVALCGHGDAEA